MKRKNRKYPKNIIAHYNSKLLQDEAGAPQKGQLGLFEFTIQSLNKNKTYNQNNKHCDYDINWRKHAKLRFKNFFAVVWFL